MDNNLLMWVWFNEAFGAANPRKWIATAKYSSVKEFYYAYKNGNIHGLTQDEIKMINSVKIDDCKEIIEYCHKNHINIYCYESEGFPKNLVDIYNPPAVLYVKQKTGNLDFLDDSVTISVVGARNACNYSLKVTDEICTKLALSGISIISGFAVGIDTCAHRAAIKSGGKTVAVLASGIDYDYPKGTLAFKEEISEHGAVISEFAPNHMPRKTDFKARNRILSALGLGVLVCEASEKSGALNTVSHAVSQGKDIFCIPPSDVFDKRFSGVVPLLRDAATAVFDERDIIYKYYENYSQNIKFHRNTMDFSQKTEDSVVYSNPKPIKITKENKKEKQNKSELQNHSSNVQNKKVSDEMLTGLTDIQKQIVLNLNGKTLLIDELSEITEISISSLLAELTELELMGVVKGLSGKRYSL
ncbi:MAG: DNA-protecting protein DprA [Clostridiales bacterium]|nr:DNA-protecting protein DprA [Clostridiales bacterium]